MVALDESCAQAGAEAILAADAARHRKAVSLMFMIRTSFLGKAFGHPGPRSPYERDQVSFLP